MKPDEELCRRVLDQLLKEQGFKPNWIDGDEPPDYFLQLGNRRLAVEVTSIHGFTSFAGKDHSWAKLSKELLSFGEEICSKIESSIEITGCYLLSIPAMPKLREWKIEISQALVRYLRTEAPNDMEMARSVILQPKGRSVRY